jgi:DNA-binding IclR family transcriptional regulator
MPGVKGMHHKTGRTNAVRRQIWQSIRILRRFTLPDILRTLPGKAEYANVRKFVASLERHGYVRKTGRYTSGRAGEYQLYSLVVDAGPEYPTVCTACGRTLAQACKETEKERETGAETACAAGGAS